MTFDDRTEKNIATLLPQAQQAARRFMAAAIPAMSPHGIDVRIISGTRTYAEQNALYAKGRTLPGRKVTNARGGYSNHNFAIAFDIGLFRGKEYLSESPHYRTLGALGRSQGLEWGGDWTSIKDEPHYQLKTGLSLAELRERTDRGQPVIPPLNPCKCGVPENASK
jgi:peptidoglycan L-alanyl-D-glutamate endopeptidase CwlK